uniref:Uncharacterized protein n=1 Tax=Salix viminalis TaxID=40686 RepID=A0A6N2N4Q2_SALVM
MNTVLTTLALVIGQNRVLAEGRVRFTRPNGVPPDAPFKWRVRYDTVAGIGLPTSNPVSLRLVFLPVRRVFPHGGRGRGGGRLNQGCNLEAAAEEEKWKTQKVMEKKKKKKKKRVQCWKFH